MIGGTGPCDFLDSAGRLAEETLEPRKSIHAYEAQLEAGCKRFRQGRYDGGAVGRIVASASTTPPTSITFRSKVTPTWRP